MTADNDDSENLSKWMGLLCHFYGNRPLPKSIQKTFESYFEYYWQNDKNYAIQSEEDLRFMQELPPQIRRDVYKDFLFQDFLHQFKSYFSFKQQIVIEGKMTDKDVNWNDTAYADFMVSILQSLEPRFYNQ